MSKIEGLLAAIDHAIAGDPWHGPSLARLLSDVDASAGSARPIPGVRSIWEIVLHLTAWTREVARRLDGHPPRPPAGGDWPDMGESTAAAWDAARADLAASHDELKRVLAAFPPALLSERIGTTRDAPLGTGVNFEAMVDGLLQHDAYHSGQIAALKSAWRGSLG
jgi:uncharacterized damage-inducible protein DinB